MYILYVFYFNMTYPPKKTIGKSHPFYIHLQKPQPLDPTTILLRPQKIHKVFDAEKLLLLVSNLAVLASWFKTPTCFEPPSSKSRNTKNTRGFVSTKTAEFWGKNGGKLDVFTAVFL